MTTLPDRLLLYIIAVAMPVVSAMAGMATDMSIDADGVSASLAEFRKSRIDSLVYDISFSIPEAKDRPVTGAETISFDYRPGDASAPLLIDFAGDGADISDVEVNGLRVDPEVRSEHIVISPDRLRDGRNEISMRFVAGDRSLNRRDDLLYSLFVPDRARTVFPCFDQPDLKASFRLTLDIPEQWRAVSNSRVEAESLMADGRKMIRFAPTEPLSTYLFAFAVGRMDYEEHELDGMTIGVYHRETDPARVAQIPEICDLVFKSLRWQEKFTACPYPFAKYDLVILPGFQFGGMEHTGATFYNDNRTFLPAAPTPAEILGRAQLIAHETTHMWFGDYVTMKWFDDVWTKEVFANYFAAEITRELLPEYNHDIEWMRTYMGASLSEDRTLGGTSIRQQLGNLRDAGLVYNNIIYNKAPIMLAKLVEFIGRDAFRESIREYVSRFGYGSATWDDLVEIFSAHTPRDVKAFSDAWVYRPGMPVIDFAIEGDTLYCRQTDSRDNGGLWPQSFGVSVGDASRTVMAEVCFGPADSLVAVPLHGLTGMNERHIIPDSDGRGYGLFRAPEADRQWLMEVFAAGDTIAGLGPEGTLAAMLNLNECWLAGLVDTGEWIDLLLDVLERESDPVSASALIGYLGLPLFETAGESRREYERRIMSIAGSHPMKSVRAGMLRLLVAEAVSDEALSGIYAIWEAGSSNLLDEKDFMNMAYTLAAARPDSAGRIIDTQRARLSNPDRISEFDFVSRAVAPSPADRDSFFEDLLQARNRRVEPWTLRALGLLNSRRFVGDTPGYIARGLAALPDVKRTGDIFFPANWSRTLLSQYRGDEARRVVKDYLDNTDIIPLLRNKVLIAAYPLFR